MMQKSIDFLKSLNIPSETYIIVGCSGGPDSMCLLDILYKERYNIVCAHVNHNIRIESAEEYSFVEKYCLDHGIIFEGMCIDISKNENEAYYRKERYNFYKRLADKYHTPYIMTAHHGDDLIETVLMRIDRGSNLKGYMGFPKVYEEGIYKIVKPLIYYTKSDLEKYNIINGIPSVHDSSNDEDDHTRNRYRHHVLTFLKKENPTIAQKYLKYSEEIEEASNYIDKTVYQKYKENYSDGVLNLEHFADMDEYLQKRELELIFKDIYKDDVDKLKVIHTKKLQQLIKKGVNFTFALPNNLSAKREYSYLYFKKSSEKDDQYTLELFDSVELSDGSTISFVESSSDESNYTTRLCSEDLHLPLYVRNRRVGDKIEIKNMKGTKSVKKLMIDAKIPPSIRDCYPIVVDSTEQIVWIPGLRKSKFDNKKSEKYDIILTYAKKGKNK